MQTFALYDLDCWQSLPKERGQLRIQLPERKRVLRAQATNVILGNLRNLASPADILRGSSRVPAPLQTSADRPGLLI